MPANMNIASSSEEGLGPLPETITDDAGLTPTSRGKSRHRRGLNWSARRTVDMTSRAPIRCGSDDTATTASGTMVNAKT